MALHSLDLCFSADGRLLGVSTLSNKPREKVTKKNDKAANFLKKDIQLTGTGLD